MIESRDVKLVEMFSHGTDGKCAQNPPPHLPHAQEAVQKYRSGNSAGPNISSAFALLLSLQSEFSYYSRVFSMRYGHSDHFLLLFAWDDTIRSLATSPVWPLFLVLLSQTASYRISCIYLVKQQISRFLCLSGKGQDILFPKLFS